MRTKHPFSADPSVQLTRSDLIEFEPAIKEEVQRFLSFTSYSLSLLPQPPAGVEMVPRLDVETGELLLPLRFRGEVLGLFVARGVKLNAPRTAPEYIGALTDALLEKLALYKRSISDPLTGLFSRDHFVEQLSHEIDLIQSCLLPGGDAEVPAMPGSIGLIVLDVDRLQWINEHFGYALGDEIAAEVGRVIRSACPERVTAARLFDDTFGLLLPDASSAICFQVAEEIRERISRLEFTDEITETGIRVTASLGHACYPQHMTGPQLKRGAREQARNFLRKGTQAVVTAKVHGRNRVFAYGDVLQKGGIILEILPMNRLAVNLGFSAGAEVGQRFLVRTPRPDSDQAMLTEDDRATGSYPSVYKGELVLVEVRQDMAFAEILYLGDPAWPVAVADQLELISENESLFEVDCGTAQGQKDAVSGLYSYSDFVTHFVRERVSAKRFCLAMLKVSEPPRERGGNFQKYMETQARRVAELVGLRVKDDVMGGNYGLGGLIYYFPESSSEEVEALLSEVVELAQTKLSVGLAAGIAPWPFMTFMRDDMLDNLRKALDHAVLLDHPRLAVFDSISLNVAADRLYMQGDMYAAIEEFKLSLLADETNGLARNSLGICYAQLGKLEQARHQFEQVILREPDDLMAHFNLGWTSQLLGDGKMAKSAYERCLELDPAHVFTMVRLAGLFEKEGELVQAERLLNEVAQLPDGQPLAMRHLARVCILRGDFEQARECLHLALAANHNDAYALHLLAKLYLDQGEDPQIAEVLARQAAALAPSRDEYWDLLVRALEEQDKFEEAEKAMSRKMTG